MPAERAVQFADVGVVAGLHRADRIDGRDIRPAEGAVVLDILDAGAAGRDDAGEFGEPAGPVADDDGEAR